MMGDCPGAGSGDWRDYDHRTEEEQHNDIFQGVMRWIKRKKYDYLRIDRPKEGEFFIDYKVRKNTPSYSLVERNPKILKAEFTQLYGTNFMIPNYDEKYKYFILTKKAQQKKVSIVKNVERGNPK